MKIAVSYLKSDDYKKCISKINASMADFLHVDMCDGKYVRNKNFELDSLLPLLETSKKPLDVHLMCKNPIDYIPILARLNVDTISFHPLASSDVNKTIEMIKSFGIKAGLAINPNEKVKLIMPYIKEIDHVLVLSVHPGKGGQSFIPKVTSKIDEILALKDEYCFTVSVDGGINETTISFLKNKNIDYLISGSYITDSDDFDTNINKLKLF